MRSTASPDLSGLTALARDARIDIRPVLLRVHTDLFVTAPVRNVENTASFEALALGFLPLVDDETAAIVARKLAGIADAPRQVLDALSARGFVVDHEPAPEPQSEPEDEDLVLAHCAEPLGGHALRDLVARARERLPLARVLLGRPDLSAGDIAPLYRHAEREGRARIRVEIETVSAVSHGAWSARRQRRAIGDKFVALAEGGSAEEVWAELCRSLGLAPGADWRIDDEADQELFALALATAGVPEEACIRIFLVVQAPMSRSVPAVFHLVEIIRTTAASAAAAIVEAALGGALPASRRDPEGGVESRFDRAQASTTAQRPGVGAAWPALRRVS